jgi:hypothetical protein
MKRVRDPAAAGGILRKYGISIGHELEFCVETLMLADDHIRFC